MKHLVFKEKFFEPAISKNADFIESIEIKGNLFVIAKNLYKENENVIENLELPFIIRKINKNEWITSSISPPDIN